MASLFSDEVRTRPLAPIVDAYYDCADMAAATKEEKGHSHRRSEIMYVNEGYVAVRTNECLYTIRQGEYILLDTQVPHSLILDGSACSVMNMEYEFEPAACPAIASDALYRQDETFRFLVDHPVRHLVLQDSDGAVQRLMKRIIFLSSHPEGSAGVKNLLLVQFFLLMARHYYHSFQREAQAVRHPYVAQVLAYMRENMAEPLTAAQCAALVHIQPTYLHRLLRKHTGQSFLSLLRQMRMEQAQKLLTTSSYSILDIAAAVGYSSQQYFTQIFIRCVGMPPIAYRRQFQAAG